MGSWANNLHVRQADVAAVVAAVREIVIARKYEVDVGQYRKAASAAQSAEPVVLPFVKRDEDAPANLGIETWDDRDWDDEERRFEEDLENSDDNPGDLDHDDRGPRERRLIFHQPVRGWVGILDSAGLVDDLGQELSNRLGTETMLLYVNDSDSWGYDLHSKGWPIGRFDSSGDHDVEADSGGMPPELQAAIEREDEAEVERLMDAMLLRNAPQGPIVFHDGRVAMPPALALLRAKIHDGRATFGDRVRCAWLWLQFQGRRILGWIWPGSLGFGFDIPRARPLDAEELEGQVRTLRDLFPRANGRALAALMKQSRFPSEDLLKQFLEIVDLPPLYAYLSYDYRKDFGDDELARDGIVPAAELRFILPPRE